ncbi:MAG: CpsD/CapB family tyrosine-protein kinase [Gammaproteobacteria bacterium]|nr:CpsD/CapB family tyrosine-protein kinase [Gammaproteobacteria bacterium]
MSKIRSKIEQALQKAQRKPQEGMVPGESLSRESRQGSDGQPISVVAHRGELQQARGDIARMNEVDPLTIQSLANLGIIHGLREEDSVVKAFRELRTKIVQHTNGRSCCVMVSGLSRECGSSYVATNLAAAFARDPSKTALLVDCSVHHPWVYRLVRGQDPLGLADYLENPEIGLSKIIHPVGIPRLRVIPLGRGGDGPAEHFSSAGMKAMLHDLAERFSDRFIIIDAPPLTESADAHILAELCDFAAVVLPYGKVTEAQAVNAVKVIDRKKFLGFVFNNKPDLPPLDWRQMLRDALGLRRAKRGLSASADGETT